MAVNMSTDDQALIDAYKKQWNDAFAAGDQIGMQAAHKGAEGVRAGYNFSGGEDGSQYIPLPAEQTQAPPEADQYITNIYDEYAKAQQLALDSAYKENMNILNAAGAKIPGQYQTARNQAAAQSGIQQGNFNEYAAASGLNSGAGGQARLAMGNQLQGNLSGISQAEADALSDLELQRTQLTTKYNNDITQAIADGNFKKAQALYDNYWRMDARLTEQKRYDDSMAWQTRNDELDLALTFYQITGDPSLLSKYLTPEQIEALKKKLGW